MRSTNQQSLQEVIEELIQAYRLKDGLNEVRLREFWELLMGPVIASKTVTVNLNDKVLTIRLNSSVLRQELMYKREEIKKALNEALGMEVVKEIILS